MKAARHKITQKNLDKYSDGTFANNFNKMSKILGNALKEIIQDRECIVNIDIDDSHIMNGLNILTLLSLQYIKGAEFVEYADKVDVTSYIKKYKYLKGEVIRDPTFNYEINRLVNWESQSLQWDLFDGRFGSADAIKKDNRHTGKDAMIDDFIMRLHNSCPGVTYLAQLFMEDEDKACNGLGKILSMGYIDFNNTVLSNNTVISCESLLGLMYLWYIVNNGKLSPKEVNEIEKLTNSKEFNKLNQPSFRELLNVMFSNNSSCEQLVEFYVQKSFELTELSTSESFGKILLAIQIIDYDIVEYLVDLSKTNNDIKSIIEYYRNCLSEFDNIYVRYFIENSVLDKYAANLILYTINSKLCYVDMEHSVYNYTSIRLLKGEHERLKTTKPKELDNILNSWIIHREHIGYIAKLDKFYNILIEKLNTENISFKKLYESEKARADKLEEKYKTQKKLFKQSLKERDTISKEKDKLSLEIAKLKKDINIDITSEEVEKIHNDLQKCSEELREAHTAQNELSRKLGKTEQKLQYTEEKRQEAEDKMKEAEEKLAKEKAVTYELQVHRNYNIIPMECFCNAIKKYKILLIGGDQMFNKINEYGLDNIKLYKAGHPGMNYDEIAGADLVIAATAYLDHATIEPVENHARTHNIRMEYFNNKNVDQLIYTIFEYMNS